MKAKAFFLINDKYMAIKNTTTTTTTTTTITTTTNNNLKHNIEIIMKKYFNFFCFISMDFNVTVLIHKFSSSTPKCWENVLLFSACVHDIHALDSKGRCWSVKQVFRVDSVEAEPSFFRL